MKIWERKNNTYVVEEETAQKGAEFLYNTVVGRVFLKFIFASRWFSNSLAIYQRSKMSKRKIKSFIQKYNINMEMYDEPESYKSFRDFFIRKRNVENDIAKECMKKEKLLAIADSKLQVVFLDEKSVLKIKKSTYDLKDLLQDDKLSKKYKNGVCLIYRLSLHDYHRYHFLDNGELISSKYIKGKLHTVRPISEKYNVYSKNSRVVSVLQTENFGEVIQIEVGAMLVGKMVNHECKTFSKMQEKGFFDFGGSTIVQIFEKNSIKIDADILQKNKEDTEVKVEIGMKIGEKA
ncbi:MAG: phosphatidylserine decarboxylase [Clostridia bacterium]|nr:phosphatidylserine decarboxylase [Clostridia bacterium]